MDTIIEITYKNYSENIIVNENNYTDFLDILFKDKSFVSYEVLQEGDFCLISEIGKGDILYSWYTIPKKVQTLIKLEEKIDLIKNRCYSSDAEYRREQKRLENFKRTFENKLSKLNQVEQLYY